MVRKRKPSGTEGRTHSRRQREVGRKIYIFCEGENTEPSYIERYKSIVGLSSEITIVKTEKNTPKELVEEAINQKKIAVSQKELRDGDQFWVVFDREDVNSNGRTRNDIESTYQKAEKAGIEIVLSNVCFEIWLLLHFEDGKAHGSYNSCDALEKQSNLHDLLRDLLGVKTKDKIKMKKRAVVDEIMQKLVTDENVKRARERAKLLCQEWETTALNGQKCYDTNTSYTDFHRLLEAIDNFKKSA